MRKDLEDRYTMFYATSAACDKYNGVWAGMVPFVNAVTEFQAKITEIEQEVETQGMALDGYALSKGQKKEEMVRKGLSIARLVYAFAEDTGATVLREKMDVSYSSLIAPRDAVVAQKCQGIHDEANGVIASLAPYNVTAADLTALQTLIDAYELLISAPRTAITVRKGATEMIEKAIREGTTILTNRMDKLMADFELTKPEFYQEYFAARIVVNTGARKEPVPPTP